MVILEKERHKVPFSHANFNFIASLAQEAKASNPKRISFFLNKIQEVAELAQDLLNERSFPIDTNEFKKEWRAQNED